MIITKFNVEKLHGYKNIEIPFNSRAKILIAENGSGKTALLSILSKFLQRDWVRLREIDFLSATVTFLVNGREKSISIKREEISRYLNAMETRISDDQRTMLRFSNLSFKDIYHFCTQQYDSQNYEKTKNHFVIDSLYERTPFNHKAIKKLLDDILENLDLKKREKNTLSFLNKHNDIKKFVGDLDILYLPTYRRIEINNYKNNYNNDKKNESSYFYHYDSEIQFSIDDVEERLKYLSKYISDINNQEYMKITGEMIDDFLEKDVQDDSENLLDLIPNINELKNFFSRIVEDEETLKARLINIEKVYENNDFYKYKNLTYFLKKLNNIIQKTAEIENGIVDFVKIVNEFLKLSGESKSLELSREKLEVEIINEWNNQPLNFDNLSSGEKHIIAMLSTVFLYEQKRLILIDEPEISLSLDWQEKILPALLQSKKCDQLVAITHSPYIFANELDEYAIPVVFKKVSN